MKVKKMLSALALGATLAFGSTLCGAEGVNWMTPADFSLGGIQPRMSLEYVKSVYGPMKDVEVHYIDHAFGYGDTESVKIIPTSDGKYVKSIIVKANNGWATSKGARVGMDVSEVQKIYGQGTANPVRHKAHHMPGYTYYTYWQSSDTSEYLTFAAKDGKVAYIKVGLMEH